MLVKITEKISVNPEFVTSIEAGWITDHYPNTPDRKPNVELWVVAGAGYHTKSHMFYNTTVKELTDYVNGTIKTLNENITDNHENHIWGL